MHARARLLARGGTAKDKDKSGGGISKGKSKAASAGPTAAANGGEGSGKSNEGDQGGEGSGDWVRAEVCQVPAHVHVHVHVHSQSNLPGMCCARASAARAPLRVCPCVKGSTDCAGGVRVTQLVAGSGFAAKVVADAAGGGGGQASASAAAGSETSGAAAAARAPTTRGEGHEVSEALWAEGEGVLWRRILPGRPRADPDDPSGLLPFGIGTAVEVEVSDSGGPGGATGRLVVRWRPAEVRALLDEGKFTVCVDGDEDFLEEYGPEDEGTEWRRRCAAVDAKVL
jgi:hypothetical protein